jgi:hypothetical protein
VGGGRPQLLIQPAGHAEVEHLGLAGLVHQDVGGLEVAVDDAVLVGVLHSVADPRQQPLRRAGVASLCGTQQARHVWNRLGGHASESAKKLAPLSRNYRP